LFKITTFGEKIELENKQKHYHNIDV